MADYTSNKELDPKTNFPEVPFKEEDIHLRDYLRLLYKHKWVIITTFVVVVATATIKTFSITPTFSSTTTIKIEKEPPRVLQFEGVLPMRGGDYDYYETQHKIIQSRSIAKKVIEKMSLWNHPQFREKNRGGEATAAVIRLDDAAMQDIIGSFLGRLDVEMGRNSRLAWITYNSEYPELSAEVADQVAQAYIDFNLESKFQATEKARVWLTGQLVEFQVKVERSEEGLHQFAKRHGIFSLEKDENLAMMRLEELNRKLTAAEAERIENESFFSELGDIPHLVTPPAQSKEWFELAVVNDLKHSYASIEGEYYKLLMLYKPDYPKMVRLRAQMESIEKRIEKEIGHIIMRAELAYKISLKRENMFRDTFDAQKVLALKIKDKSIQYNILKREVDTNKELYDGLLQRVKETGVSAGLESSNIQVVDRAVVPRSTSKPNNRLNILMSMFVGLFLGVGLAFFREYFDNTVKNPDEIMKLFGLPTLGLIPSLQSTVVKRGRKHRSTDLQPSQEDLYLITKNFPRSSISEATKTFRTSLLFSSPGHPPKTILVTSTNPKEGKTFVSCNLGIVLAQGGAKTLLVDADLRRPFCHKVFSVPASPGLTDNLMGHATLKETIRHTDIKNLSLLPCGPISPNPAEFLDSSQFKDIIEKLKASFDFIIFDSAPIMGFADTLNLANKVDGAVVVNRGAKTTRDELRNSLGLLRGIKANILGVVINIIDLSSSDYYYYNYYYAEGPENKSVRRSS